MNDGVVEFLGKTYPIKSIEIPTWGHQLVSITDLQDVLLHPDDELYHATDDDYVSADAQRLDEEIFFYLNPEEFASSHIAIGKLIRESIG